MIIFCCTKCKMTDLGEVNEEKRCMRCGIPMLSTGMTSAEWNELGPEQMKETVDKCVAEYNRINAPAKEQPAPAQEPVYDEAPRYDEASQYHESLQEARTAAGPEYEETKPYAGSTADEYEEEPSREAEVPPAPEPKVAARRKTISEPADRFNDTTASGTDNEGKFTKLSIAAFVCSLIGCTTLIGIILGIVDLVQGAKQGDNRKKGLSIAAIAVGAGLFILGFVMTFALGGVRYIDKVIQRSAIEQAAEAAAKPEPEPETVEEPVAGPAEEDISDSETAAKDTVEEDTSDSETAAEDSDDEDTSDSGTGADAEETDEESDAEGPDEEDTSEEGSEPLELLDDDTLDEEAVGEEPAEGGMGDDRDTEDADAEDADAEKPDDKDTSDYKPVSGKHDEWASQHDTAAIAAASIALNGYISNYEMSLAPKNWSLARYDDTDTVIGVTDVTYNGKKGHFVYVGTLNMKDNGKIDSATSHYLEVNGEVLNDDGYCDNVKDRIKELDL